MKVNSLYLLITLLGFIDFLLKYYFYKLNLAAINTGISFGILANYNGVLIARGLSLVLIVILFIVISFSKSSRFNKFLLPLYGLLVAGLSNFFSLTIFGGVVDYINLIVLYNNLSDFLIIFSLIYIVKVALKTPNFLWYKNSNGKNPAK